MTASRDSARRRWLVAVAALLLMAGAVALTAARAWRTARAPSGGRALVYVRPGETLSQVAGDLRREGVISSAWLLAIAARIQGADRAIQPGVYLFRRPLTPDGVLARLRTGSHLLQRVTIPEGLTVLETAATLEKNGLGPADAFACTARDPRTLTALGIAGRSLEGYLFPDTYTFVWSMSPEEILGQMVERFRQVVWPGFERRAQEVGFTVAQAVTLASLIEKETGRPDERALVSAVFHNRLREGMRLESDPTVLYGRSEGSRRLTRADLRADTAYNTYKHAGLPPGPIASPGRAALHAALHPADVDYLYFVSRNDGTHEFSRTLSAHERAVDIYQRK